MCRVESWEINPLLLPVTCTLARKIARPFEHNITFCDAFCAETPSWLMMMKMVNEVYNRKVNYCLIFRRHTCIKKIWKGNLNLILSEIWKAAGLSHLNSLSNHKVPCLQGNPYNIRVYLCSMVHLWKFWKKKKKEKEKKKFWNFTTNISIAITTINADAHYITTKRNCKVKVSEN